MVEIRLPTKIAQVFEPTHAPSGKRVRYRGLYGGRGSGKSVGAATMAWVRALSHPGQNILCCRELQNSIKDSVHALIVDSIEQHGMRSYFDIGESFIRGPNDVNFIFKGLRTNAGEIKSMHNLGLAWIEEAQSVSQKSLDLLAPTVRADGSEIWATWNPDLDDDPIHDMLAINTPDNAIVAKINYYDNPFFSEVLEEERLRTLKSAPHRYHWIWEGGYNLNSDAAVYGKWLSEAEEAGRVRLDVYDPDLPVFTAWDLGYSDDTAIWWYQVLGNEVRLIDYYSANREDLQHYAEQIYGREITNCRFGQDGKLVGFELGAVKDGLEHRTTYNYAKHYVPHDAANKLLQAGGRSIVDQLHAFGIKAYVVAATSQQNQIEATRYLLQFAWFDKERCKEGIRCLRKYSFKQNDNGSWSQTPIHDQWSHGADALEIVAQAWQSERKPAAEPLRKKDLTTITINELFYGDAPIVDEFTTERV